MTLVCLVETNCKVNINHVYCQHFYSTQVTSGDSKCTVGNLGQTMITYLSLQHFEKFIFLLHHQSVVVLEMLLG